jgi:conflict system pore-forming effector with SLATT domain
MGLNFVAEYLKIPLEIAVDLRKRQDRSNQSREKLSQGYQTNGSETFQYYESTTRNDGTIPLSPTLAEYLERRFIPTLHWYQIKVRSNSIKFIIWKIVIISFALFIAILNALTLGLTSPSVNNPHVILASSIAAIVILTSFAYLQASKIHEGRIHFTHVKQRLEREYQLFMLRAKHYARREGINDSYSSQLFVENIESILSNE